MEQKSFTAYQLAVTGLMTALICILGPMTLTIPVSPIPISLANLAICLSVLILGMKFGTLSCLLYLLIGLIGLPVFSGFSGGVGKLVGYIFLALIGGYFADKFPGTGIRERVMQAAGLLLGAVVLDAFGTIWLAYMAHMGFGEALWAGVIPFIPGDLAKIFLAAAVGPAVRKRLLRQNLLAKE